MPAIKLLSTLLCLIIISSCSKGPVPCLGRDVQNDIDDNPELNQRHIEVKVIDVRNGYITLDVEKGFPTKTMYAIFQGKTPREIQMSGDASVDVLIELEGILKKRPKVKAISWTAEGELDGVNFRSLPGSSTSTAGRAPRDDEEANCLK
jgi:hypothetical protein